MSSLAQCDEKYNLDDDYNVLQLRPYQREAVVAVEKAEASGVTRPLLSLPTGTGKTVIFAHLITQRAGRALVLAHRDELIQQAADKIRLVDSSLDVGIVKAERDETDAPVVVGSVQTLYRPRRHSCLWPNFRTSLSMKPTMQQPTATAAF